MIILDTNVISEAMTPKPNPVVVEWLNDQLQETLYISSVTVAEVFFGIGVLPEGSRKRTLARSAEAALRIFDGRVLSFDGQAARVYAQIAANARKTGHPLAAADGYIAAIAMSAGFVVATRNVRDFEHCGVQLINPWEPSL